MDIKKKKRKSLYNYVTQVVPGETALAFYKAKNPTDKPVIGISTYNVVPFEAGQYFNKIQVSVNKAKIAFSFTQTKTVTHKLSLSF